MVKNLHSREPLSGVPHQEFLDQILSVWRDVEPLIIRKVKDALLDSGEEAVLTVLAWLSLLPPTVLSTLTVERRVSTKHDVPTTPYRKLISNQF